MKKVSVVILNWNGVGMLRQFLPFVMNFSKSDSIEICVADNNSTDNSCEVIENEYPEIRLIRLDKNYGFAEGYNRALQQIDSEYVVLLNSDVEVTENWLMPMIDYMDNYPNVVACQPKIISFKNKEIFEYAGACGGFLDKYGYPFCRGRIFSKVEKDNGQYDNICSVLWASGAALFIRLKDYIEVGGLDSQFFAHMEEIDLCWRLKSRGKEIVCIPKSKVFHVGGATLSKDNPKKTYLNFRNNLLMLYKNLPEDDLKKVFFARYLFDRLAILLFLIKLDFCNAKAVIKARRDFKSMRNDFKQKRSENISKSLSTKIDEKVDFSILFAFHLRNKKKFSLLRLDKLSR